MVGQIALGVCEATLHVPNDIFSGFCGRNNKNKQRAQFKWTNWLGCNKLRDKLDGINNC